MDNGFTEYFERCDNDALKSKLKRILAKKAVALALRRFDILEFPATIRNLFTESKASRSGSDEQNRMLALSHQLLAEANDQLRNIELILESGESGGLHTGVEINKEDDLIHEMP